MFCSVRDCCFHLNATLRTSPWWQSAIVRWALRPSCSAAMSWWALGWPAATAHSCTVTGRASFRSSSICKSSTRRFSTIFSHSSLSSCVLMCGIGTCACVRAETRRADEVRARGGEGWAQQKRGGNKTALCTPRDFGVTKHVYHADTTQFRKHGADSKIARAGRRRRPKDHATEPGRLG